MLARSGLLSGLILDMRIPGDSIYTAELRTPAALASYVLFVIKFLPSIRTWDQLNGVTLGSKSSHREVKRINRVRGS